MGAYLLLGRGQWANGASVTSTGPSDPFYNSDSYIDEEADELKSEKYRVNSRSRPRIEKCSGKRPPRHCTIQQASICSSQEETLSPRLSRLIPPTDPDETAGTMSGKGKYLRCPLDSTREEDELSGQAGYWRDWYVLARPARIFRCLRHYCRVSISRRLLYPLEGTTSFPDARFSAVL